MKRERVVREQDRGQKNNKGVERGIFPGEHRTSCEQGEDNHGPKEKSGLKG